MVKVAGAAFLLSLLAAPSVAAVEDSAGNTNSPVWSYDGPADEELFSLRGGGGRALQIGDSVSCGGHRVKECGECPWNRGKWMGKKWCNGECRWAGDECMHKTETAWCGGHAAKECATCPDNNGRWMGSAWCNGKCVWELGNCIPEEEANPNRVSCGGHTSPDCGHCPWDLRDRDNKLWRGRKWCNGECKWQNEVCIDPKDIVDVKVVEEAAAEVEEAIFAETLTLEDVKEEVVIFKEEVVELKAWCGGHAAESCATCPDNNGRWMASKWCNGDCMWMDEKCVDKSKGPKNGYHEKLGECRGAVCSLWGDPHIVSCDGLAYDCQGHGIFTLMKNHLYNIQGNFIPVGAREQEMAWGWGLRDGATITNDIMVDYLPDKPEIPTMQFTFPDLSKHEKQDIMTEEGCEKSQFYDPLDMVGGGKRSVESTLLGCRTRCENTPGCAKFSYWADGGCHLQDENAILVPTPSGWSRNVAGTMDGICGKEIPELDATGLPIESDFEKSKTIGNEKGHKGPGCPILFYLDGELQDISDLPDEGYLYGDEKSDHSAKLVGTNEIHVKHLTETGAESSLMLKVAGNGPGEIWSCHWNFWVCLPHEEQDQFEEGSLGLFGTPNGKKDDDWMDPKGMTLPLPWGKFKGRESFDYCRDNWCVTQEDSIMAYPTGKTYDDVKCDEQEYIDVENPEHCVMSLTKINDYCKDMNPLLLHSCKLDCCLGGCLEFEEVAETVVELQPYVADTEEDYIIYDPPVVPKVCDEEKGFKASSSETACPDSPGGIVTLLDSSDTLPRDKDIIYGITLSDYDRDEDIGRTVKFHVSSPFDNDANVYVRYEKKVGKVANDPVCDRFASDYCGPTEIEAGCVEFPGVPPFAVVDVYFASNKDSFIQNVAAPDTEVEKCCHAPFEKYVKEEYDIVKYTFEIQCACPPATEES